MKNTALSRDRDETNGIQDPKVSILIPVYNGANYLREAIDSALSQTYMNVEVLVINDGSSDGGQTENIAKSYGDRIRYFSKENGGVSSALNLGIREMTGEYFSWLSHDDLYYNDKIAKQISFLREHPQLKVVFSNSEIITSAGETRYVQKTKGPDSISGAIHVLQTWIFACALLVHRSCFDTIGLFNESNRTTQDIEFIMNLLHAFTVGHMQEPLVKRRDHAECGIYLFSDLNLIELNALLDMALKTKGISFFFPGLVAENNRKAEAKAYEVLGDAIAHAGIRFSKDCYKMSAQICPSPFNFSSYKKHLDNPWSYYCARISILAREWTGGKMHTING